MASSGINLVNTDIGLAVSTLFIVFICTRPICARIQLRAARRSRSGDSALKRGSDGFEASENAQLRMGSSYSRRASHDQLTGIKQLAGAIVLPDLPRFRVKTFFKTEDRPSPLPPVAGDSNSESTRVTQQHRLN